MKMIVAAVFTVLSVFVRPLFLDACTSFAVYSEKTIYGMNFDYKPNLMQFFTISSEMQGKVFHLRPFGFGDVAGMNDKGLFSSCQGLIPEVKSPASRSNDQISTWIFHEKALSRFEQVAQAKDFLKNRQVVQAMGSSLHNFIADRFGDAMVVETGKAENQISGIHDRYHIMTNFPVYQLKGKSYEEAEGVGAERYKVAHRYIKNNLNDFDIDKGLEVLKLAQNKSGIYQTRCSMAFDPNQKTIYISLEGDFDKIWKVSLENQTIETFRGFVSFKRELIPAEGISSSELSEW